MTGLGQWARWSCWWLSNYPCWDCISRQCSNKLVPCISTPDDHFTAGPHCRVTVSGSGRVGGAGGCPTIRAGIVSPAGVEIAVAVASSTPDDHFTAGPDCRVRRSASGRVGGAGGCPTVRAGIVSPASVQKVWDAYSHPRRSFHCRSRLPCDRLGQRARWSCWWLSNYPCWDCISRQCSILRIRSAPDDHFTAGPDCRVTVSGRGRIGGARSPPLVCAWRITRVGNFRQSVDNLP